jgi:hypothetical protein
VWAWFESYLSPSVYGREDIQVIRVDRGLTRKARASVQYLACCVKPIARL